MIPLRVCDALDDEAEYEGEEEEEGEAAADVGMEAATEEGGSVDVSDAEDAFGASLKTGDSAVEPKLSVIRRMKCEAEVIFGADKDTLYVPASEVTVGQTVVPHVLSADPVSVPASVDMQSWKEGDTTAFSASHLPMIVSPDPKTSLEEGDCQVMALAKLSSLCFLAVKYSFRVCDVAEGEGCDDDEEGGGSGAAVVAEGSEEEEPVPLSEAEGDIGSRVNTGDRATEPKSSFI